MARRCRSLRRSESFPSPLGEEGGGRRPLGGGWGAGQGKLTRKRVVGGGGEGDISFHGPLAGAAHIAADSSVLDVFDKGKDKGAVIRHKTVLRNEKGEELATLVASRFARGDGGFGGPFLSQPQPPKGPTRAPGKRNRISSRPRPELGYHP